MGYISEYGLVEDRKDRMNRPLIEKIIILVANCILVSMAQQPSAPIAAPRVPMSTVATNVPPMPLFALPLGAKVLIKDDSGKTWRQNGIVTGAVQTVQAAFSNQLVKAKFKCKHVIPLEEKTGRVLEEWRKGDQSLLLMLWPGENGMTMFSWGISNE